ncbi:MAG: hypothetical protein ROW52_09655 [Anaerolineaceae bacterium]|jgi:hypothetical protein
MRKKFTFLLTILPAEDDLDELCGRLQLVQSNRAETFTNLEELHHLIMKALRSDTSDASEVVSAPVLPSVNSSSNGNGLNSST